MEKKEWDEDKAKKTATDCQGRSKPCGFEEVKSKVADNIHKVAETLREKAAGQDTQSGAAHYRKQASEWLEQSAEYVRQFDYREADTRFRDYVKQSPERSLLIAGATGLIIGAIWRRR